MTDPSTDRTVKPQKKMFLGVLTCIRLYKISNE